MIRRRDFLKGLAAVAVLSQLPMVPKGAEAIELPADVLEHGWTFNPKTGIFTNAALSAALYEHALRETKFRLLPPFRLHRMQPHREYGIGVQFQGTLTDPPHEAIEKLMPVVKLGAENGRRGELRAAMPGDFSRERCVAYYIPAVSA